MFKSTDRMDRNLALFLIVFGVLFRVWPHPDNFTPTTAIALFAGVVLPTTLALTVPIILMICSDLWIGFHGLTWLVWLCFFLVAVLGVSIRGKAGWGTVLLASLFGSVFFFLVTNLGVFLFQTMYPKSIDGFIQCYVMAIPFFRNSLLSDLIFSFALFGVFATARSFRTVRI